MGLGKTHQAMALIAAMMEEKEILEKGKFLIVCPTSVIYHWQDKLRAYLPSLPVHTFHGFRRSLNGFEKGILLTTYGVARIEREKIKQISFELAVLDEIQSAKNPRSRAHTALSLVQARMKIGLTGTPIENNLQELKALFDLVLPGYLPGEAKFREYFMIPIEKEGNEERRALLSHLIHPFILRRRKKEVLQELPDKTEDKLLCDLTKEQIELYVDTSQKARRDLGKGLLDERQPVPYVHIFSILSTLKQVCNHPALYYKDPQNYKNYSSGKWDLFVEILQEVLENDQKVVIFSQYLLMLDIIQAHLKELGIAFAEVRGSTIDRRGEIERFQKDPQCKVFLGSLSAAGVGIDLTAASSVILYDRWWNAAKERQAIDRVHRIGQKWAVQVYYLVAKETIEEKIDRMIEKKDAF